MTDIDPRDHQSAPGEKVRFPAKQEEPDGDRARLRQQAQQKAGKNNKHRDEQTGRAIADAEKRRDDAEYAA